MSHLTRITFAGEIDHGKSSLLGRLLITTNQVSTVINNKELLQKSPSLINDGLINEIDKTIDLAFKRFETKNRVYQIIDSPGHFESQQSLISAFSQSEGVIFVIDATTVDYSYLNRFLELIRFFSIECIGIALSKIDLLNYAEEKIKARSDSIRDFFSKLNIIPAFVVPISSFDGDNLSAASSKMSWYKGENLIDSLDTAFSNKRKDTHSIVHQTYLESLTNENNFFLAGYLCSGSLRVGQRLHCHSHYYLDIAEILVGTREQQLVTAPAAVRLKAQVPICNFKKFDILTNHERILTKSNKMTVRAINLSSTDLNAPHEEIIVQSNSIATEGRITAAMPYTAHNHVFNKGETPLSANFFDIDIELQFYIQFTRFEDCAETGSILILKKFTYEVLAIGIILN